MPVLPSVFVSHGGPHLVLDPSPGHAFLAALGMRIGRPKAVLCVSAHWESATLTVSAAEAPATVHDFSRGSAELDRITYPAPGSPELATRTAGLLAAAGFACAVDAGRGLDHGAWVPMRLMYPAADVPVAELSITAPHDPDRHLAVGRALRPLLDEGVLVLGSGGAVHNPRELSLGGYSPPAEWAVAFDNWLRAAVDRGDAEALVNWRYRAPGAELAHPRAEHFLPLLVAAGAAGPEFRGETLHHSWELTNLSLSAFAFHAR